MIFGISTEHLLENLILHKIWPYLRLPILKFNSYLHVTMQYKIYHSSSLWQRLLKNNIYYIISSSNSVDCTFCSIPCPFIASSPKFPLVSNVHLYSAKYCHVLHCLYFIRWMTQIEIPCSQIIRV